MLLTLIFILSACKKEPDAPTIFPLDAGVLSSSESAVVLNTVNPSKEAVKISWTALPNSLISYSLVLSSGNRLDTVSIPQNSVSKTFSMGELNNILVAKLGMAIGVAQDVKAVVYASIPVNGKTAETNAITLKITPAEIAVVYPRLWMVGDATPAGWNIDAPTPLVNTPTNPFEFTYNGPLNAGEFKIPVGLGDWNGDFFMPVTNGEGITSTVLTLIKRGNPDNKWKITAAGNYKITINLLFNTIRFQKL